MSNEEKVFFMNVKRGVMWSKRKIIIDETTLKYYNPRKRIYFLN
jgi:hypothetical protein